MRVNDFGDGAIEFRGNVASTCTASWSERASGLSSMMGMLCSSAMARIFSAIGVDALGEHERRRAFAAHVAHRDGVMGRD